MKAKKIVHMKEDSPKILLIEDLAGYGKISLSAMIPIMSHMGYNLYNLPTALVSNTLDYGLFHMLETTGYMRETLKVWKELGFSFDAICTGMIVSEEQVRLVAEYCQEQRKNGVSIYVDPVMGDDGTLYNGISENTIKYMRNICSVADVIMPNYTEAAFLADKYIDKDDVTRAQAEELVDSLRKMGSKSIVITSISVEGQTCVYGYDDGEEDLDGLTYLFAVIIHSYQSFFFGSAALYYKRLNYGHQSHVGIGNHHNGADVIAGKLHGDQNGSGAVRRADYADGSRVVYAESH